MLKIRLRRMGARSQASYRMVIVDSRKSRDGKSVEIIGNYNPRTEPPTIVIKEERALYWLKQGAQPTDTTARLLGKAGIMGKFKPVKEKA
jgi:small subunit ribosomal protein S16